MTTTEHLLTPGEYAASKIKFDRLNAKAAKKGIAGRVSIRKIEDVIKRVDRDARGYALAFPIDVKYVKVEVTREEIKHQGWTFVARVDRINRDSDAFTLAVAPGQEDLAIDRSSIRLGACDHCGRNLYRKNTYVVRNEAGEFLQVGAQCISDFLGHHVNLAWEPDTSLVSEEEAGSYGVREERQYRLETIVAFSIAATEIHGWVPAGKAAEWEKRSTRSRVEDALSLYPATGKNAWAWEAERKAIRELAATKTEQAAEVIEYVKTLEGWSDYAENARVIAGEEWITGRQIGIACSFFSCWKRAQSKSVEAAQAPTVTSEFLGQVKDKVTTTITLTRVQSIASDYGTSLLILGTTEEGNVVKTFTTSAWAWDDEVKEGATVTITGTIKALEEYQGTKQTSVTRTKRVA